MNRYRLNGWSPLAKRRRLFGGFLVLREAPGSRVIAGTVPPVRWWSSRHAAQHRSQLGPDTDGPRSQSSPDRGIPHLTDLPLVRSRSTVCALNSSVKERLRRAVIMDILHGLNPTHQECPPERRTPTRRERDEDHQ